MAPPLARSRALLCAAFARAVAVAALPSPADLAVVSFASTRATNALWNKDAFPDLTPLRAHGRVTLLNASSATGGVVTSLHVVLSADGSREAMNDGVSVAVSYEGGAGPAFIVPFSAFFFEQWADSGPANFESTLFARRTRNSLHCRAPMPFRRSVVIELVSALDEDVGGYAIATYETGSALGVPAGGATGYFMAQHTAQASPDWPFEATRVLAAPVVGAGHVVAVGYTATTARSDVMRVQDNFNGVCEGNWNFFVDNATALPGNTTDAALVAFLGSEDFFGQSYGWTPGVGARAGTTYIGGVFPAPIKLATYRDLSDAPIRFEKSLAAAIQWDWDYARIPAACLAARGACPVDFRVTVFYYATNATRAAREVP